MPNHCLSNPAKDPGNSQTCVEPVQDENCLVHCQSISGHPSASPDGLQKQADDHATPEKNGLSSLAWSAKPRMILLPPSIQALRRMPIGEVLDLDKKANGPSPQEINQGNPCKNQYWEMIPFCLRMSFPGSKDLILAQGKGEGERKREENKSCGIPSIFQT